MSRRTSTTRAYKSGGAGRTAGGEPAPVRRGSTGKDPRQSEMGRCADTMGGQGGDPRGGGLEGDSGVRLGAEWEGRRFLSAWWTRGWRLTQPYAAPAGTQMQTQTLWRNIKRRTEPPTPFPEAERLLRHPFEKVGRRCWSSGDAPPHFLPCPQSGDSA